MRRIPEEEGRKSVKMGDTGLGAKGEIENEGIGGDIRDRQTQVAL